MYDFHAKSRTKTSKVGFKFLNKRGSTSPDDVDAGGTALHPPPLASSNSLESSSNGSGAGGPSLRAVRRSSLKMLVSAAVAAEEGHGQRDSAGDGAAGKKGKSSWKASSALVSKLNRLHNVVSEAMDSATLMERRRILRSDEHPLKQVLLLQKASVKKIEEAMKEQEAGSEEAAVEIVPDGDEAFGKAKESLELTFPDRGSKPAVKKVKEA